MLIASFVVHQAALVFGTKKATKAQRPHRALQSLRGSNSYLIERYFEAEPSSDGL
jgi:hypothetical protein